jgi:glucosamine--fructose-6-phosphate aminotransferase (isomerizing)
MYLTYSELKDQYDALKRTLRRMREASDGITELFDRAKPKSLVFFGCGSSHCIAESLAMAAWMNLRIPAVAMPAGDFMLHRERYAPALAGSLAVAVSRSGSTSELIEAVRLLKAETNAPAVSIVCAAHTPLAALSELTVEMPWAFDKSVCQTRTVSCLYAAGMLLVAGLSGRRELAAGIETAVGGGQSYMEWIEGDLKFAAAGPWTHAVTLADAELAGIAAEGALAFKEICQRPSNFYHLLDSRHGPMVMIGPETLVIAALSDANGYELALLEDAAAKGARLVVYSDTPVKGLPKGALNISFGQSLPHAARGLPFILLCQMLAYHRAVFDGVNPDEPEGLSPWIKL